MSFVVQGKPDEDKDIQSASKEAGGHANGQPHDRISLRRNEAVEITAVQRMLSATSGSLLTSLLVTPLDVVRVRLQSQPVLSSTANTLAFNNLPPNLGVSSCCREVFWVNNNANFCMATTSTPHPPTLSALSQTGSLSLPCAAEETSRRIFTSTYDGLKKIARNEGLTTLWRGLSPTLAMVIPANVIYFTGYDWLRYNPSSPLSTLSPAYIPLIAGSVARIGASTAISPLEMFRTRLQASSSLPPSSSTGAAAATRRSPFTETLAGIGHMVQKNGYTSLWRGLTLTLWRDVPFSGLYWWGYESVRSQLTAARERHPALTVETTHGTTFNDSFLAGLISGAAASIITMPFDVGKTRQQVYKRPAPGTDEGTKRATARLAPEERSMPRFLWHIVKEEGVGGLFTGCAARVLKVAPACAIMISSYEVGKVVFRRRNERARDAA